jgi:hypothetical protein
MKRIGVSKAVADAAVKHIPDLFEEIGNKSPLPGGGKLFRKLSELILGRIVPKQ